MLLDFGLTVVAVKSLPVVGAPTFVSVEITDTGGAVLTQAVRAWILVCGRGKKRRNKFQMQLQQ